MIYKSGKLLELMAVITKLKTQVFPIETQYKMIKLYRAAENELSIYQEQKQLLAEQYVEKDENGQFKTDGDGYVLKPDTILECVQKFTALENLDIKMPDLYFSLDELQNLGLTLDELLCLDVFIKD